MKTRFDKIIESPKSLAKFLDYFEDKTYCDCCAYTLIAEKCNHNNCYTGVEEWLKQPLPMSEQFTDEDVEKATELKKQGYNYIAKDFCNLNCTAYTKKPYIEKGWLLFHSKGNVEDLPQRYFINIGCEDEPVSLDDIINSRNIQKTIDK